MWWCQPVGGLCGGARMLVLKVIGCLSCCISLDVGGCSESRFREPISVDVVLLSHCSMLSGFRLVVCPSDIPWAGNGIRAWDEIPVGTKFPVVLRQPRDSDRMNWAIACTLPSGQSITLTADRSFAPDTFFTNPFCLVNSTWSPTKPADSNCNLVLDDIEEVQGGCFNVVCFLSLLCFLLIILRLGW
jgi:hypothetical protein